MTTRNIRGFTLMELMVVITIIGILAGLSVGVVGVIGGRNKIEAAKAGVLRLKQALDAYYNDLGAYPPTPTDRGRNAEVIGCLTGDLDHDGVYNPEAGDIPLSHPTWRRPYLKLSRIEMDSDGNFLDPWRSPYRYIRNLGDVRNYKVNPNSFLLYSCGPDRGATDATRDEAVDYTLPNNKDNVKNWEDE
jgi:prepilin-type N-terminal cleavage/methylation domain-containing protein